MCNLTLFYKKRKNLMHTWLIKPNFPQNIYAHKGFELKQGPLGTIGK